MDVRTVSVPVETRAPSGRTNAYVLGTAPAVLVDPPAPTAELDDAVDAVDVGHVAVTHHHADHVGALARYADRCDATVWARRGRTDAFVAATGVDPDRTFADGTEIETGDGPVRVVETPGHAPEHVAFACDRGAGDEPAVIACGDLVVAEGSVAVAAPEGDVRAYLSSLRRVRAMAPGELAPGHGPSVVGEDVASSLDRLLSHRLDREERVQSAVEAGARTVPAVCDRAYESDLTGVRDLAEATVRAHLEKLAVEGRVSWNGDRARPPG